MIEQTTANTTSEDTTNLDDLTATESDETTAEGTEEVETKQFDEAYVRDLREENKRYRLRAKQADELTSRLHRVLVELDGRLQDPDDLPYSEDHLEGDAITTAIDDLLERKPHLKARRAAGNIGAGESGASEPQAFDIINAIRGL